MHEISLLENVREILQEHSSCQNFKQVKKITLEIGRLSCVEPDALRFGFDVVMQGSLAEGAELILAEVDGVGWCDTCEKQVIMETLFDPCPTCGNAVVTVTQGGEMKIKNLVVI